jgi:hypothetical protein
MEVQDEEVKRDQPRTTGPLLEPLPTPEASPPSKHFDRPLSYIDIYVDDFCGLVQGNKRRRTIVKRILMNTIDEVLRPPDPSRPAEKEPISVKKLRQGDAS